jgi:hypothetical protein
MTDRTLNLVALEHAYEALALAAGDMNVAAILAPPRSALVSDANVLADALDAEQAALLAAVERYA